MSILVQVIISRLKNKDLISLSSIYSLSDEDYLYRLKKRYNIKYQPQGVKYEVLSYLPDIYIILNAIRNGDFLLINSIDKGSYKSALEYFMKHDMTIQLMYIVDRFESIYGFEYLVLTAIEYNKDSIVLTYFTLLKRDEKTNILIKLLEKGKITTFLELIRSVEAQNIHLNRIIYELGVARMTDTLVQVLNHYGNPDMSFLYYDIIEEGDIELLEYFADIIHPPDDLLRDVIRSGMYKSIVPLINIGYSVESLDEDLVYQIIKDNDVETLRILVDNGYNVCPLKGEFLKKAKALRSYDVVEYLDTIC